MFMNVKTNVGEISTTLVLEQPVILKGTRPGAT